MTGRGIDQALPHPGDPRLFEPYVRSATRYVELAEERNGPIRRPLSFSEVWGDSLEVLERLAPNARIINLETSVTTSDRPWRRKAVHYRMHPRNLPCIKAAGIDCCVLANNHTVDWGFEGLRETLSSLAGAGVRTAGAGLDSEGAAAPAILNLGARRRVLVYAYGSTTSGIPAEWEARVDRPGVNLLEDLSPETAERIAGSVAAARSDGDVVIASIHWGANWGYEVPAAQQTFARRLIDEGAADVVHGHSSHHFKGIEVYRERPILYGCGDLLNDYEGIAGREEYRSDVVLLYFPTIQPSTGKLLGFRLSPMQIRRFRLNRTSEQDMEWVRDTLTREGDRYGTWAEAAGDGTLALEWS